MLLKLRKTLTRSGPFKIKKNVPQNNPTVVLTKRLSDEFRNKIERPKAVKIRALIKSLI